MGADKKIRKRRWSGAAAPQVGQERLTREKGSLVRNGFAIEGGFRERGVEVLDR
jgi:hypothetical protein